MVYGSRYMKIAARAFLRGGSKVGRRWPLAALLPGLMAMTPPAALAEVVVRNAQGFRVCEGFNQLTIEDAKFREYAQIPIAKRTKHQKDYVICLIGYRKKLPNE